MNTRRRPHARVDSEGHWTEVGPELAALLGERTARGPGDLLHPEDRRAFDGAVSRLRRGLLAEVVLEVRLLLEAHAARWHTLHLCAVPRGDGADGGFDLWLTDAQAAHGAGEVARILRRDSERRLQALVEFTRGVSHDLQEPLRMISTYTFEVARGSPELDERSRRFLGFALDAAERLRTSVSELLEHARLERSDANFGRVDLALVLSQAQAQLALAIDESGAAIEWDPGEAPFVVGDRRQLVQLFQNLLSNSLRHGSRPRATVRIGCRTQAKDVLVTVEDDGPGERSAVGVASHARADADRPGLGLAICRRVVEDHGGRLYVESLPGGGTRVVVTLRAADRD